MLVDVKTLHYSANTYPDAALRPPGVWRRRRVQSAVDRRANAVKTEYDRHARELDRRIHGVTEAEQEEGTMGPIQNELQRYEVEGQAFGTFGEASSSVHAHLCTVARAAAQRWRMLGARSFAEAYGRLKSAYYRKWGAAIARAKPACAARASSSWRRAPACEYAGATAAVWRHRVRSTSSWLTWVGGWEVGLAPPPRAGGGGGGDGMRLRACAWRPPGQSVGQSVGRSVA